MTTHNKLRLANLLMLTRLVPVLISVVWTVSNFPAAANGKVHIAEALMKVGFAYMFAIIVSCGGAVWSLVVEKRSAGVRVGGATALRLLVVFLMVAPLVIGMF